MLGKYNITFILLKCMHIALFVSINPYTVFCKETEVSAKTENMNSYVESFNLHNEDRRQLENNVTVFQEENKIHGDSRNIKNETIALNNAGVYSTSTFTGVSEAINNTERQHNEEGRAKKKKRDKFNRVVMKLDKGRLLKFDGSFMVPTLMGVLLKVATAIPVILAISTVVGTISLIGSKISLLISAILGVRTLIQYYNQLNPPAQEPPPITQSDMVDIQNMISKQNQISDSSLVSMSIPSPPPMPPMSPPAMPPMKPIPISMTDIVTKSTIAQTPAPADLLHTNTATEKPHTDAYEDTVIKPASFDHSGLDYLGIGHTGYGHAGYGHTGIGHFGYAHSGVGHLGHPGAGHFGVTHPDLGLDHNYAINNHLYHPENYFVHNPSGAELNTHNLIHHNQLALGESQHHYGAPYFVHNLKRIDGNVVDKNKLVTKLKSTKKVSAKDVVKKVSDMLKNNGQNQNVISKVKIVKTVKNR